MLVELLKLIGPKASAFIVSFAMGHGYLADDLISICHRESRCAAISVHEGDAHGSVEGWTGQVQLGHLNPECQPKDFPGGWATRGAFGLSAASHHAYMPACYQPDAFDIPLVSAWVALRKYVQKCRGKFRGWCHVNKKARRDNPRYLASKRANRSRR